MKYYCKIHIIFALFVVVCLQACVNDFGDCPDSTPGIVKLRFNLNLGALGHITRADGIWNPSGETDFGSSFDNAIMVNDDNIKWLHVMIINSDGDLLHLNLNEGFQLNPNEGGYDMTATLDFSDPEVRAKWQPGEYRVMVLANFRNRKADTQFSSYSNIDELYNEINDHNVDWFNKNGDDITRNNSTIPCIPMWGMTKAWFNFDGVSMQTFSIDLLRAVAKVKLLLTPKLQDAGYRIVDCKVDNLYRKIYGLPEGWKDAERTSDMSQSNYDAAFHANTGTRYTNMVVKESTNPPSENDGDGSLVFYLPEWDATKTKNLTSVTIEAQVADDLGNIEKCSLTISNESLGRDNYQNDIHNVNRNHLYQFTLDKDISEGELSYKLECWNLQESAIGWNPPSWLFTDNDSEAEWGYVSLPSYSSDKNKILIENTTAFADYEFTLTGPEGAVWKAFLVEDGIEYSAEDKFVSDPANLDIKYSNANTPHGFFFGVGNDDKNNQKAASTGIARKEKYNIKVGTRLQTTDFSDKTPETLMNEDDTSDDSILKLNYAGNYWKEKGEVPTCYLIIKIALDGKNFSDPIPINPLKDDPAQKSRTAHFKTYRYAGDATRIEIRQLPPFYTYKTNHDNGKFVIGKNNEGNDYSEHTWWDYPMGHKDAPDDNP